MPKRPYVSFAEVREKVPIPDVLEVLGIADQFTRKGNVLTGKCPLPQHPRPEGLAPNTEQFKIDRKQGVWLYHCFGDCHGADYGGGDVITFVKAMTGLDDSHTRLWFAQPEHFGDRLSLTKPKGNGEPDTKKARERRGQDDASQAKNIDNAIVSDTPEPLKPLKFFLRLDPDVPYLRQRGVTPELAKRYGCGLASRGVLKGFVCFPVFRWPKQSNDENAVGYLGRWPADRESYDDEHPRYKAAFETGKAVFGLPQAMETPDGTPIAVVEDVFKTMHVIRHGHAAVSTFSATVTNEQADILVSTGRPIALMFDGSEAAYQAMRTAAAKLITRTFVRVVKLPLGVEPDDLDADQLRQFLP